MLSVLLQQLPSELLIIREMIYCKLLYEASCPQRGDDDVILGLLSFLFLKHFVTSEKSKEMEGLYSKTR